MLIGNILQAVASESEKICHSPSSAATNDVESSTLPDAVEDILQPEEPTVTVSMLTDKQMTQQNAMTAADLWPKVKHGFPFGNSG